MDGTNAAHPTFFSRANDLHCRTLSARFSRLLRARLRNLCHAGLLFSDDPRVCRAWLRGWDAAHYVRLLRWRDEGFRPRVVYDIGAHEGLWSAMAQSVFTPETIVLFEPHPESRERALAKQPATGSSWKTVPAALGEAWRTTSLNVMERSAASSLLKPSSAYEAHWGLKLDRREEVQVVPLDGVVASDKLPLPDLVKIDVQGYEHLVLRGGNETLRHAQRLVIEASVRVIYENQPLLPEVLDDAGYLGFMIDDLSEGARLWPAPPLQFDVWLKRET